MLSEYFPGGIGKKTENLNEARLPQSIVSNPGPSDY
jgi:hypothetical protein